MCVMEHRFEACISGPVGVARRAVLHPSATTAQAYRPDEGECNVVESVESRRVRGVRALQAVWPRKFIARGEARLCVRHPEEDGENDPHAGGVQEACVTTRVRAATKSPKTECVHVPQRAPLSGCGDSGVHNLGWRTQSRASPEATDSEASGLEDFRC